MAVLLLAKAVDFSFGGVERGDQNGLGIGTGWEGVKQKSGGGDATEYSSHIHNTGDEIVKNGYSLRDLPRSFATVRRELPPKLPPSLGR
jgi:hypothetical protein